MNSMVVNYICSSVFHGTGIRHPAKREQHLFRQESGGG